MVLWFTCHLHIYKHVYRWKQPNTAMIYGIFPHLIFRDHAVSIHEQVPYQCDSLGVFSLHNLDIDTPNGRQVRDVKCAGYVGMSWTHSKNTTVFEALENSELTYQIQNSHVLFKRDHFERKHVCVKHQFWGDMLVFGELIFRKVLGIHS